ncbi:MAG: DinB family protein [Chloroflexi bacterium]|nr:DinB family protein [Chloroflexota bacterium]
MSERERLQALFAYNAYANRLALDTAARMSDAELDRPVGHAATRGLLQHVMESDAWLLALVRGASWQELPAFPTLAAMCQYWDGIVADMQALLAALPEADLARVISVDFGDHRLNYTVWEILMQTSQHAIHHRGELSVVMTSLGYPLPTLDIMLFFADRSGQHWPFDT